MAFVNNLIGGIVIMVFATLVGVAQNSVRSDPINLFPKIQKPKPTSIDPAAPTATGVAQTEEEGEVDPSPDITEQELAAGEVSKERLRIVMETGLAFVIDARGEKEFAEGHLPAAMNIPYEKFMDYSSELSAQVPVDVTVIVYCRSITCDLSDDLAQELRLMGYERVVLYRGGWDEWSEAGFPSEVTPLRE